MELITSLVLFALMTVAWLTLPTRSSADPE